MVLTDIKNYVIVRSVHREPRVSGGDRVEQAMRRPPAGWQPRWRRSGRTGARSGTALIAAMNATVASRRILSRRGNNPSPEKALDQRMGRPRGHVETAAKIATRPPSDRWFTVDLLSRSGEERSKFSPRKSGVRSWTRRTDVTPARIRKSARTAWRSSAKPRD